MSLQGFRTNMTTSISKLELFFKEKKADVYPFQELKKLQNWIKLCYKGNNLLFYSMK